MGKWVSGLGRQAGWLSVCLSVFKWTSPPSEDKQEGKGGACYDDQVVLVVLGGVVQVW